MHKITSWFDNLPLKRKGAGGGGGPAGGDNRRSFSAKRNRCGNEGKKTKTEQKQNSCGDPKWYQHGPFVPVQQRALSHRNSVDPPGRIEWSSVECQRTRLVTYHPSYTSGRRLTSVGVSNCGYAALSSPTSCYPQEDADACTIPPPSSAARPHIRTNPWYTPTCSLRESRSRQPPPHLDTLYASLRKKPLTDNKNAGDGAPKPSASLEESLCSSGYGSHDSSPESSVHTPEWQSHTRITSIPGDKEVEEEDNVSLYDECLQVHTATSDDGEDSSDSECGDCCAVCRRHRAPPQLSIPPPPPLDAARTSAVLCELNGKLVALQHIGERLRTAVREAHGERERRFREKQRSMEQIQSLKGLKWNVRHNFELAL